MKIALVYFRLTTQAGGQQQVYSLAQELVREGHVVVLYAAEIDRGIYPSLLAGLDIRVVPPQEPFAPFFARPEDGVILRVRKKRALDALYTATARRIAAAMDTDFDAVNCHEDFAYRTGRFYKRRNPRARVVWTMNNPPYMRFPKARFRENFLNWLYVNVNDVTERPYFRAVDAVAVLSRYEKTWAEARGLPVSIVWSGVDFKKYYAPVKSRTANAPATLMGLGALTPARRYEDLIDAVALLRARGREVRAEIIAKDVWREATYRSFLLARVREKSVANFVAFNFDGVSEEGLREAYRRNDIFVLTAYIPPPQGYGWGLVVFEAASAGLPVVLYSSGGAAHVLTNDAHALFARPCSAEDIAAQVERLVGDPALYCRIAEGGQRFVREHLSWQRYAREMVELYKGVTGKARGGK